MKLSIKGMSCGHCVTAVTNALEAVPGVTEVSVDLEAGRAEVGGDADLQVLIDTVEEQGYKAEAR